MKKADPNNKAVQTALCVLGYLMKCFERFIKFLNKNAYIQCAITSNNFCLCCKDAFYLIFRNAFLFAIAAGIGEVFIWAGKIFITLITVIICWVLIDRYEGNNISMIYSPLFVRFPIPSILISLVHYGHRLHHCHNVHDCVVNVC